MTPERIAELRKVIVECWENCSNNPAVSAGEEEISACSACPDYAEMLDEIERLTEATQWRDADDTDVEAGKTVLVTDGHTVDAGYWSGADWCSYEGPEDDGLDYRCVAWRPLPGPPKVMP